MKNNRIVLFLIVTGLYWFTFYTYVPVLSTFAEARGASHGFVGIIIGSYGFTQMLLRIPLGMLSDRLNKRKFFVALGLFIGTISSLGMWFLNSPAMLLLFRSLAGAAASAWVAYTILFSSYFNDEDAPKAIGYITAVTTIGQSIAIFTGGTASDVLGNTSPFLIGAIVGLLGLFLCVFVRENPPARRKQIRISDLAKVITKRGLLLFSVLAIFIQFITFATVYGFTPVAAKSLGASDSQLGLLTTLSTLPAALASALSGSLFARRIGEKNTLLAGFALSIVSCVSIPFIGTVPLLFVSQIVGGFSRGMIFPLLMGLSIKFVESGRRASAMGFFQSIYGLGMFLGPSITGLISDSIGIKWGFWVTGLVGLAGFLLTTAKVTSRTNTQDG